jgi:PAS domain-containing protein
MSEQRTVGARLLLPLTRLEPAPSSNGESVPADASVATTTLTAPATPTSIPRTLDLDAHRPQGRSAWLLAVRTSAEACLLLDADGRICAASSAAGNLVGGMTDAIGAKFADLVSSVDFTSGAAPDLEPERSMPPLRALATGGLARGLMRVRVSDGTLVTYDVVAVPLERQQAVLAFFVSV